MASKKEKKNMPARTRKGCQRLAMDSQGLAGTSKGLAGTNKE